MRALIAVILILLASHAIAQEGQRPSPEIGQEQTPDQQVEPPAAQEQPADQPAIEAEPVAPAVVPTDPPAEEHDSASPEDGTEDAGNHLFWGDGVAQWAMAGTGIAALFLSWWAVCLVNRTLRSSQDAVLQATRAADAALQAVEVAEKANALTEKTSEAAIKVATDANAIARSSFDLEARPTIIVKASAFGADDETRPLIQVMVANIGRSTAIQVEIYAALDMVDWPPNDEDLVLKAPKAADRIFIQPQDRADFPVRRAHAFSELELWQMEQGKTRRLGVFGQVIYRDRFDTEYVTPFAATVSGGPNVATILSGKEDTSNIGVRFEMIWTKHSPT